MSRGDDLIREAFNEPDVTVRDWSAREQADIDAIRRLRADLQALRAVPEPQLSVERVRDAVLKAEMRTRVTSSWRWAWITAPVGLGVALVAYMALRPAPEVRWREEAAPALPPSLASSLQPSSPVVTKRAPTPSLPISAPELERPIVRAHARRTPPSARVVRRTTEPVTSSSPQGDLASPHEATTPGGVPPDIAPTDAEVMGPVAAPADHQVVVVIESRPQVQTGSRRANEIEARGDVLFGG